MAEKIICEVKRVAVEKFDPRKGFIVYKVTYVKNNVINNIVKEFNFSDAHVLVTDIVREIKRKDKALDLESDDMFEGYQVVDFIDQDDAEEKLLNFFNRMNEKLRIMRKTSNAASYMKMFDEMKVAKMEL